MSARALAQLAVVALALAAASLAALLLVRGPREPSASLPADAGACDLSAAPPALSPQTEDVVLLLSAEPQVTLTLDGQRITSLPDDPVSFPAGEHLARAECAGKSSELSLTLVAFSPAALHAGCGTFTVFGAECEGCPKVSEARKAAAKGGHSSPVFAASAAQEKLELSLRNHSAEVLLKRWNALTERYSRALQVVGREAPGAVASANGRFEQLSQGFSRAVTLKDLVQQDASVRAAEETFRVFVRAARLARPADCDYQKRLTDSF
jgi:hypothetical protein